MGPSNSAFDALMTYALPGAVLGLTLLLLVLTWVILGPNGQRRTVWPAILAAVTAVLATAAAFAVGLAP